VGTTEIKSIKELKKLQKRLKSAASAVDEKKKEEENFDLLSSGRLERVVQLPGGEAGMISSHLSQDGLEAVLGFEGTLDDFILFCRELQRAALIAGQANLATLYNLLALSNRKFKSSIFRSLLLGEKSSEEAN
jgi:hypothetical protein